MAPLPWDPASCDVPRWRLACRMNAGRCAAVEIVLGDREYPEIDTTKRLILCAVLLVIGLKREFGAQAGDEVRILRVVCSSPADMVRRNFLFLICSRA